MTSGRGAAPAAVWFLYAEAGQPLGQVYRSREEAVPAPGARLANGPSWRSVEVVRFIELASTCALRRFRVVVRVLA